MPGWVYEQGLTAIEQAVLLKLWRHRSTEKGKPPVAWPSRANIIQATRINKDTLNKVLNRLESLHLIRREREWRGQKKYVRFHLLLPAPTMIPKQGMMQAPGESESEGPTVSESEGNLASDSEGLGSNEIKLTKEVSGGAPAAAHTHPIWFSEIAAEYPNVDCVKCWPKFVEHYRERQHPPSRERFASWCSRETVFLRKRGNVAAVKVAEPTGWRDWLKSQLDSALPNEDARGQLDASFMNRNFSMLPPSWQQRARAELEAVNDTQLSSK